MIRSEYRTWLDEIEVRSWVWGDSVMGIPSQPHVAQDPTRAITSAQPSASFEVVFCDYCSDLMAPDQAVFDASGLNICPLCLEEELCATLTA